jgi:hypothetical protein
METLMQTAYAFSPHIEATAPGVCTIELKGLSIQTNETSAKQWAAEILRVLKQFHLLGQIGFAETPALALLAAHAAKPVLVAQEGRARCPHRAAQSRVPLDTATAGRLKLLTSHSNPLEILKRWASTPPAHSSPSETPTRGTAWARHRRNIRPPFTQSVR